MPQRNDSYLASFHIISSLVFCSKIDCTIIQPGTAPSRNVVPLVPSAMRSMSMPSWAEHPDRFERRHNGLSEADQAEMLKTCNAPSMADLMNQVVPAQIRGRPPTNVGKDLTETEALDKLYKMVQKNQVFKSYIGMGYHNTITPPAILRNIIQNPGWYTPYTPYQAEISQGRMESLVTYQTMIADLTAMPIAQASLLVSPFRQFFVVFLSFSLNRKCKGVQNIELTRFYEFAG